MRMFGALSIPTQPINQRAKNRSSWKIIKIHLYVFMLPTKERSRPPQDSHTSLLLQYVKQFK
jgi:hypothetical protein